MLRDLLDEGARFDAEYGGGLSNHLPMALVALRRLGADDAQLARFAASHAARLEPAPAAQVWPAGDAWASRLGDRSAWPVYRQLFGAWLAHEGATGLCQQVLPVLMSGCGAAAFHGLIRVAYALQVGHAGELADALAYWACRHLRLGEPPPGSQRDPADLLVALDRAAVRWVPEGRLIFERMRWVAAQPGFGRIADRLRVDDTTLPRLAELGARLHAATGDFTALHLVTSGHAMRVVLSVLDDDAPHAEMVGHYWRAFAAAVASIRSAPRGAAPVPLPWPELVAAALGSDDEHLVKLVDSCREQDRALGGGMWRRAATRGVLQART